MTVTVNIMYVMYVIWKINEVKAKNKKLYDDL